MKLIRTLLARFIPSFVEADINPAMPGGEPTRVEPTPSTSCYDRLDMVLDWLEQHGNATLYRHDDPGVCLIGQYGHAHGFAFNAYVQNWLGLPENQYYDIYTHTYSKWEDIRFDLPASIAYVRSLSVKWRAEALNKVEVTA